MPSDSIRPSIPSGMDPTTSAWILEFLLRQPHLDPWVPHRLLSVIPVSNAYPRLHKTLLLRSISSDLSHRSISDQTLESLELLGDLDHSAGLSIPESMQAAYAAVAVESTVKFLRSLPSDYEQFVKAVERIWNCRVSDMQRDYGHGGLVSVRLMESKKEILAAVDNRTAMEELAARHSMEAAADLVRIYLEEAVEMMGPSFLEYAAAEAVHGRDSVGGSDGVGLSPSGDDPAVVMEDGAERMESGHVQEGAEEIRVHSPQQRGRCKVCVPLGRQDASVRCTVSATEGMLPTSKEVGNAASGKKYDCLPSPDVMKAKEALRSSSTNLHTVVEDPLPNALEMAEGILTSMATKARQEDLGADQSQVDMGANDPSKKSVNANNVAGTSSGIQYGREHEETRFPGFMARNRTARTYEWDDDSIESPSDGSPDCSRRLHLPTPKNRAFSPLKQREIDRYSKRRKIKKWSLLEEQILRKAVQKYGTGNWRFILNCHPDIFVDRTMVDLKDKWRNMLRG